MSDQIIPDTNDPNVAILALATYYADKFHSTYIELAKPITEGENETETYIEDWKEAFKSATVLAHESLKQLPF